MICCLNHLEVFEMPSGLIALVIVCGGYALFAILYSLPRIERKIRRNYKISSINAKRLSILASIAIYFPPAIYYTVVVKLGTNICRSETCNLLLLAVPLPWLVVGYIWSISNSGVHGEE